MNLVLFRYRCKSCKEVFLLPGLPGNPYGEFLMHSKNNEYRYLNAFSDPVFKEFQTLYHSLNYPFTMNKNDQARIFQKLFSICCDKAQDGSEFSIHQLPSCPACNEESAILLGPENPPRYIDVNVKPITHDLWDQLSQDEKKEKIKLALEAYCRTNKC